MVGSFPLQARHAFGPAGPAGRSAVYRVPALSAALGMLSGAAGEGLRTGSDVRAENGEACVVVDTGLQTVAKPKKKQKENEILPAYRESALLPGLTRRRAGATPILARLGFGTDVKRLVGPFTAGEFGARFFTEVRKAPRMKNWAVCLGLDKPFTTEEFSSRLICFGCDACPCRPRPPALNEMLYVLTRVVELRGL